MPEHTPAPTPARSLYGFFMYLFSKTVLGIYCIWAFTPDHYLHYFNIYYYPQKYWSSAIPIQLLIALTMFAFLIYPSSNLILTYNINSMNTISDTYSHKFIQLNSLQFENELKHCSCVDMKKCIKPNFRITSEDIEMYRVPQLYDLNIRFVSRKLYLNS